MSAATILFTDIVSFSKRPTSDQRRLIGRLTAEVQHELHDVLHPPRRDPNVLALPTGDGMALAFLHGSDADWNLKTLLGLTIRLHRWAAAEDPKVLLRVGIHAGAVELITDINGRANVCGDTINYTQRVMDAASPRQTLLSEAACREYFGAQSASLTHQSGPEVLAIDAKGPFEVFAKHGVQIPVYKLEIRTPGDWYSNDDPEAKHQAIVKLAPLGKVVGPFAGSLQNASSVALIQLTGERLRESLQMALDTKDRPEKLWPKLERLWIFMPSPKACEGVRLPPSSVNGARLTPAIVEEHIEAWKAIVEVLRKMYPDADIQLGVLDTPIPFGASFVDWDIPGGRIHVSPLLQSASTSHSPAFELAWMGQKPSAFYKSYVNELQSLHAQISH